MNFVKSVWRAPLFAALAIGLVGSMILVWSLASVANSSFWITVAVGWLILATVGAVVCAIELSAIASELLHSMGDDWRALTLILSWLMIAIVVWVYSDSWLFPTAFATMAGFAVYRVGRDFVRGTELSRSE